MPVLPIMEHQARRNLEKELVVHRTAEVDHGPSRATRSMSNWFITQPPTVAGMANAACSSHLSEPGKFSGSLQSVPITSMLF